MRKLGLLTTLWTALLLPLSSFALGLGEIEVSSFLNQPLKAEISVVSVRSGEIDNLLVSLASRDAFRKAGLERPSNLSKLRFKVEKSEDGSTAKILVSTKTAVKEPFLNFLVEADWARGRLLREFTVLLDPPYFTQQSVTSAPQVTAEQASTDTAESVQDQPIATRTEQDPEPAPATQSQSTEQEQISQSINQPVIQSGQTSSTEDIPLVADNASQDSSQADENFVVSKGDTLWGIAKSLKDEAHSMAQVMLALQATNPDAFGQDNIHSLNIGAVLRAPEQGLLDSLSKQEAYAQVLEQNGLWDDYVARKTGEASTGSPVAMEGTTSDTGSDESGQLSLLAPGDSDSSNASLQNDADDKADSSQVRKQLALAEEDLEAARLENDDLKSRISALELQLGKYEELQKLVQIEDDSLAQLQDQSSEYESISEQPSVEVTTTEVTDPELAGMEQEPSLEQQPSNVMVEAADDEQQVAEQDMTESQDTMQQGVEEIESTEAETVLDTVLEEAGKMAQEVIAEEGAEEAMAKQEMVDQGAASSMPAPVIVTETPTTALDGGLMDMLPSLDDLLTDPIMLGGVGAVLLLLLGLIFVKRKKSDEVDEGIILEDPTDLVDDDATPIHLPTVDVTKTDPDAVDLDDTGVMDTEQSTVVLAEEQEQEEDFSATGVMTTEELPTDEITVSTSEEQDDVLNEVDVYLAYGLYDNAEDLLKESLENNPDRADYRAKLLDTYFATKNGESFVREAEALKSLGGGADRYWNRVQIMGFELAPDNELFADAKDSDLSAADLEYTKPETADFDIGGDEDLTDFSNTDFELGDETLEIPKTQVIPVAGVDDFSDTQTLHKDDIHLSDFATGEFEDQQEVAEAVSEEDLPDNIGEIDFDLDERSEDLTSDIENADEDILDFNLPDNLDLSTDLEPEAEPEPEIIELDPTVEAPNLDEVPSADEEIDGIELSPGEPDEDEPVDSFPSTDVVAPVDTANLEEEKSDQNGHGTMHFEAALDLDMSDMADGDLNTANLSPVAETIEPQSDDNTELRPASETDEFDALIQEAEQEAAAMEVDTGAGVDKTGTFAPGDFNDEASAEDADAQEAGDIEGLMLPDDVDEVGTKLDLAKAFIDMGDSEGAKSSLEEIMSEGTEEQKAEATELLAQIK